MVNDGSRKEIQVGCLVVFERLSEQALRVGNEFRSNLESHSEMVTVVGKLWGESRERREEGCRG